MFDYTIQKIANGYLFTYRTPDDMVTTKHYFENEWQAWKMLSEIAVKHMEDAPSHG